MRAFTKKTRVPLTLAVVSVTVAALASAGPATAQPERPRAASTTANNPAHSLAAARTHEPVKKNSWKHDTLARHTPQNWYRVSLTSRIYLYSLLGNLPADYNLRLYDDTGKLLSSSDRSKVNAETIGRMLNPGTYFVRV